MGGAFTYGRCDTCGSLALEDAPEDLGQYYPTDYYSFEMATDPGEHPVFSVAVRQLLRVPGLTRKARRGPLARLPIPFAATWLAGLGVTQQSAILDVGSGAGSTLARFRQMGFRQLAGIDPYLPVPEHVMGPVTIRRQTLAETTGQYDLILFNHVLEHIPDPIGELTVAAGLLAPNGHVIVRVPLADSQACEEYGDCWAQLDAPRHLTLPTQRGFEGAVGAAGLRVADAWRDSNGFQFWGSEQYRLGITKFGPRSWEGDPEGSPFNRRQIRAWEADSRKLNRRGRGDQGTFVLSRIDAPRLAVPPVS